MRFEIMTPFLYAYLRDCWVIRDDLRLSAERPNWTDRPTWHAIVIESIQVKEAHRRQGHCRRFIEWVAADQRYEIAIGEAVQDKHLADALKRWGWDCNPQVMDFYRRIEQTQARTACEAALTYFDALANRWASHGGQLIGPGGTVVAGNLDDLFEKAHPLLLAATGKADPRTEGNRDENRASADHSR